MPFPTEHEVTILKILAKQNEGIYARDLLAQSRGKVKQGSLYTTLNRMQGKGFVRVLGDAYHRRYALTAAGERAVEACRILTRRSA